MTERCRECGDLVVIPLDLEFVLIDGKLLLQEAHTGNFSIECASGDTTHVCVTDERYKELMAGALAHVTARLPGYDA